MVKSKSLTHTVEFIQIKLFIILENSISSDSYSLTRRLKENLEICSHHNIKFTRQKIFCSHSFGFKTAKKSNYFETYKFRKENGRFYFSLKKFACSLTK